MPPTTTTHTAESHPMHATPHPSSPCAHNAAARPTMRHAPAAALDDDATQAGAVPADAATQAEHALCLRWAHWVETRRFFGPPPALGINLLAKLQRRRNSPAGEPGGPDAECSSRLMALHAAITAKPADDGGRQIFELFYRHRVRNVKRCAAELGINRATWYRRLAAFRATVVAESARIEADRLQQRGTPAGAGAQEDA